MLSLTAALNAGWRIALLASLAVPVLAWLSNRRLAIDAPPPSRVAQGRLPGVFWVAAAMLFCTTAAEWCITAWGATFVEDATGVSTDTAVALMAGYFGGVLAGRTLGSRLARRHDPARLLAFALAVTAAGFAILWPSTAPAQALAGLSLLGLGLGNLFPMGMSVTVALAPERTALASGRAVAMTSFAVLLAPLTVGALADATSLTAALGVVPVILALAAAGLTLVRRAQTQATAERASPSGAPGGHTFAARLVRRRSARRTSRARSSRRKASSPVGPKGFAIRWLSSTETAAHSSPPASATRTVPCGGWLESRLASTTSASASAGRAWRMVT